MGRFENIDAWRLAHRLVLAIYRATAGFPSSERFGLISQSRRAAFSVAANIAEGSAKRGTREFRRFVDIALGSLAELRYVLMLARDLGFLSEPDWEALNAQRDEVGRVVWALYRSLSPARPSRPSRPS